MLRKLSIALCLAALPDGSAAQIIAEHEPDYGAGVNWNAFTGQSAVAIHLTQLSNGDLIGIGQRDYVVNADERNPFSFKADSTGFPIRSYGRFGSQRTLTPMYGNDYWSSAVVHPDGAHWVLSYPESAALSRYQADGYPDSSFGSNGVVFFPPLPAYRYYSHFGVLPDGKIILCGRQGPGSALLITRLLSNGATDTQFGSNGHLLISTMRGCLGMEMLVDGRFLVHAELAADPNVNMLTMFTGAGTLDPAFMGDGTLDLPMPLYGIEDIDHFDLLDDGRVLVGGESTSPFGSRAVMIASDGSGLDPGFAPLNFGSDIHWMQVMPDQSVFVSADLQWRLHHFLQDGAPDAVFGFNGELDLDRYDRLVGVVSTSQGTLAFGNLIRGDHLEFGVTRLIATGAEDVSFSNGGTVGYHAFDADVLSADMAVDNQGRAVGIGGGHDQLSGNDNYWVGRIDQDGLRDTTFSDLGALAPHPGPLRFVGVQPNNDLIILGQQSSSNGFTTWPTFTRVSSTGQTPENSAQSIAGAVANYQYVRDMRIAADGKICFIVSCPSSSASSSYIGRLSALGDYDPSFGTDGVFNDPHLPLRNEGYGIDLFPNGDVLAVQTVEDSLGMGLSFNKLQLRRLSAAGIPVASWGIAGRIRTDLSSTGGISVRPKSVRMLPDGRFLVAYVGVGYTAEAHYIARFLENGQLDASFGANGIVNLSSLVSPQSLYEDEALEMVVQPDNKITMALRIAQFPQNYALVRLLPNGSLDLTFGADGVMPIGQPGGNWLGHVDLALTPTGQIMVSGDMNSNPLWTMTDWFTFVLAEEFSTGMAQAEDEFDALRASPNPSAQYCILEFNVPKAASVKIILQDSHGRRIVNYPAYMAQAGLQQRRIEWPANIANGLYSISVVCADRTRAIPIVIHRE